MGKQAPSHTKYAFEYFAQVTYSLADSLYFSYRAIGLLHLLRQILWHLKHTLNDVSTYEDYYEPELLVLLEEVSKSQNLISLGIKG